MATDRVICPRCGAQNIESPIITMCSSCMGSLAGARPAPEPAAEAPPEPSDEPEAAAAVEAPAEPEPAPAAAPADFQPPRAPEVVPPTPPPEPADFQPARSPDLVPTAPGPLDTELPSVAEPGDFQPARTQVPPLEIPTISPAEEPAQPEPPSGRPLKLICPNCSAANPPHYTRCSLCNTELPTTGAAEVVRGMAEAMRQRRRSGEMAGQTKGAACCGCVLMAVIAFVVMALSAVRWG